MQIGITGSRSTIVQEALALRPELVPVYGNLDALPLHLPRYLICSGYLSGKNLKSISPEEATATWERNFLHVAQQCERIFDANHEARVCVISSESAYAGSYDMAYAGAKAALNAYVETKKLTSPGQRLIAIAPTVIWDAGMTRRRNDLDQLAARGRATRQGRWLLAREVAQTAMWALLDAPSFLSGIVIRMKADT